MSIKNSCNFTRIVPEKETDLCYNHKSIGYFEQGIFTSRSLELSQKTEMINWIVHLKCLGPYSQTILRKFS